MGSHKAYAYKSHVLWPFLFVIISTMTIIKNIREYPSDKPNGYTAVYLLGYGGAIWHSRRHTRLLRDEGYKVLAMDFHDVLKHRDPQDLINVMDEVEDELTNRALINTKTIIVGVSMGGLIGFNMLKRHSELDKLLVITGGNMALIPKSYRQKWPVSYADLEDMWQDVNIYAPLGSVKNKQIIMILPSRDKMIDPEDVAKELQKHKLHNTIRTIRPKGGHFRTIITETILRPKNSVQLINEMISK